MSDVGARARPRSATYRNLLRAEPEGVPNDLIERRNARLEPGPPCGGAHWLLCRAHEHTHRRACLDYRHGDKISVSTHELEAAKTQSVDRTAHHALHHSKVETTCSRGDHDVERCGCWSSPNLARDNSAGRSSIERRVDGHK